MRNLYVVRAFVLASSPAEAVRLALKKSTPKEAWLHEEGIGLRIKALADRLDRSGKIGFGQPLAKKSKR